MPTPTTRLSLLLRAFVDQDEDEVCDQLDALREDVAERGRFPDVVRALKAYKVETDRNTLESVESGDIDDDVESDAPYVDDPDAADADY